MKKQQQLTWFTGKIIDASQKLLFEDAMELEQGFIVSITQGRILNLDEISQYIWLTISTIGVTHPEFHVRQKMSFVMSKWAITCMSS